MRIGTLIILLFFCFLATLPATAGEKITISFVGDVNPQLLLEEPASSLERLKKAFVGSDVVFANLESPLTTYPSMTPGKSMKSIKARKDYVFKSDPAAVKKLKYIGFTVFGLANNHMMDYCEQGLKDTLSILAGNNLLHCGAGYMDEAMKPAIVQKNGIKTAFISYSEIMPVCSDATAYSKGIIGINYPPGEADFNRIKKSIDMAKQQKADIIVISLHWGLEGSDKIEAYQRTFSRRLLDSGADCIIGHHPHVLRPVETYKGKVIAYSLGNFIFGSPDRATMILTITFEKNSTGTWTQQTQKRAMWIKNGIPVR